MTNNVPICKEITKNQNLSLKKTILMNNNVPLFKEITKNQNTYLKRIDENDLLKDINEYQIKS